MCMSEGLKREETRQSVSLPEQNDAVIDEIDEDDAEELLTKTQPDDDLEDALQDDEDEERGIDNFSDVAALASDATTKVGDVAKNAAGQMTQTAKSAYSRTAEAAKRARNAAMTAGAQAAVKAEQNQIRAAAENDEAEVPVSSKELISQAWLEYFTSHKSTVLYGAAGFIAGLCILCFGFWPVLLVLLCTYAGMLYGRYRDGDAKIVNFLKEHFDDED